MTELVFLAYRHGYGYDGGWVDWLTHTVLSSIIHGMIYNLIFRVMNRLTLQEVAALVVVVLVLLFIWARTRDRGGW